LGGFISPLATISPRALIGDGVRIYGPVTIEPFVVIEPNVILGHPSPTEQNRLRTLLETAPAGPHVFDTLFDAVVQTETRIEQGSVIRSASVIYSGARLGKGVDVGHAVMIRKHTLLGIETQVLTGTQINAFVTIGNACRIAGTLCNRTEIGHCSSMLGHAMHRFNIGVPGHIEPSPRIGNGVTVGREASLIGDVEIGDYAIVGAGAVVTRSIPGSTVWVGDPAMQRRVRAPEELTVLMAKVQAYES